MPKSTKKKNAQAPASDKPLVLQRLERERVRVKLAALIQSDLNPRGKIDEDSDEFRELVDSVARFGVLQPPLARPYHGPKKAITHELVYGHRRTRAAEMAGLTEIEVDVARLSDPEVIEIALHENHQRRDVDPLREGEALKRLRDEFHVPVEELAARTGLTRSFVYRRLRLAELPSFVLKMLRENEIAYGVAMQLARLRDVERQRLAAEQTRSWGLGHNIGGTREMLEREFLLDLKLAGWKLDDATLVPEAGACSSCPNRAKNQQDLFGEVARGADLCTDSRCFERKRVAYAARAIALARDKGHDVVDGKAAERFFKHGRVDETAWLDLDQLAYELNEERHRKWRKVLAPVLDELSVTVVPDAAGVLHHLVGRKEAIAKAREAKLIGKRLDAVTAGRDDWQAQQNRQRKRAKAARDRDAELLAGVLAKLESDAETIDSLDLWFPVGLQLAERALHEDAMAMARRHELALDRIDDPRHAVRRLIESARESANRGLLVRLVVELACSSQPHAHGSFETAEPLRVLAEALGVEPRVNAKKRERRAAEKAKRAETTNTAGVASAEDDSDEDQED